MLKCKSYERVKAAADDNLTVAKLQVFSYIASLFQPLLTFYQKDAPLFPFLYQDLKAMLKTLLSVIVYTSLRKETRILAILQKIRYEHILTIYEGLRRPRWSQFASEIYKVDTSVRHLQRRYLELPPLRIVSIVDSIVTSSVPISLENTKTTRTRLKLYI